MQTTSENCTAEKVKKAWHRPDFVSFDTAMEVTAYVGRN